ncbi:hypothetical protein TNCV_5090471 [Trichonephila clavipes]|nr:hypothetical protein TNCV_5090471 [Trichonephila clavipes]
MYGEEEPPLAGISSNSFSSLGKSCTEPLLWQLGGNCSNKKDERAGKNRLWQTREEAKAEVLEEERRRTRRERT